MQSSDLLIGIDAGTSVMKAVAFDLGGTQVAAASVPNRYATGADGSATQSMAGTWAGCSAALRALGAMVPALKARTAAIAVTGQGDGTWLVGADDEPVGDAWLWLDARAAPTVARLQSGPLARLRFEATGTGLNTCQQGAQLAHMQATRPDLLDRAETALHCKDWLYLKLTGIRATDPSEACFTFGDFRTRRYDDAVIEALGLTHRRSLLPGIVEGTETTHPLTPAAATATGLRAGTPVVLGYVDMAMTALGAGVHTGAPDVACSIIGSTGVHLRATPWQDVVPNADATGYIIALPLPGVVTQVQTNMAATLNLDWILSLAGDLAGEFGPRPSQADLVAQIDGWLARGRPGAMLYHPYISEAGERGPFVDAGARASFTGLSSAHRFPDLVRAVVEGLGFAARDCHAAIGPTPAEVRLTGGATRSRALRGILAAALGVPVRVSSRDEAGAAGAAMMAAVAVGVYATMEDCIAAWVVPHLGRIEPPDAALAEAYARLFPAYRDARSALAPVWTALAKGRAAPAHAEPHRSLA